MEEGTYNKYISKEFIFFKTKGKKNPPKGMEKDLICKNFQDYVTWRSSDPDNTIKVVIPKGIQILDFDCHSEKDLSREQINILSIFLSDKFIPYERTPNGIHIFLECDLNTPLKKQTKVCSIGCKVEIFPPGSIINIYNNVNLDTLDGSLTRFPISCLYDMRKGVMSIAQQGDRHNSIRTGLQSYNPDGILHELFNMLWASPPLDLLEFQDISKWVISSKTGVKGKEKNSFDLKALISKWEMDNVDTFIYDPWGETWLKKTSPFYPVYKPIPMDLMKKEIFFWSERNGSFLSVKLINVIKLQLEIMMQMNEEQNNKLCFEDGVYIIEESKFINYQDKLNKGIVVRNKIPLQYQSLQTTIPIVWKNFLDDSFNFEKVKAEDVCTLIIAHIMGVVKLQVIYYIFGNPRSGKSVLSSVFSLLFGDEVLSTSHDSINNNPRFFTSQLLNKRLVLLPDARMEFINDSTIDILKRITGGDLLSTESKNSNFSRNITGDFPVIITSQSDLSWINDSGLYRRLIPLRMGFSIPLDKVVIGLEKLLVKDCGWLIYRGLSLTQETANSLYKELQSEANNVKIVEDPIGILITEHLKYDGSYFESNQNLYARLEVISQEIGVRSMKKNKFFTDLIQQIGLRLGINIKKARNNNIRGLSGLRLINDFNKLDLSKEAVVVPIIDEVVEAAPLPLPLPLPSPSSEEETVVVPITNEVVPLSKGTSIRYLKRKKKNSRELFLLIQLHQKRIASQIKENLNGYCSRYSFGKMHTESLRLEANLDLWVEMFTVLSLCDEIVSPGELFSELYQQFTYLHYKSSGEKFKWFKSKRVKSRIYPHKLYIPDKFYPRAYEVQDVILDDKGKKIGTNTPNVSMEKLFRETWYSQTTRKLLSSKAYTVDLSAAHLCLFVAFMHNKDLEDCVKAEDMWGTVMNYLPERFKNKRLLKKLLYSGLNGGSYKSYTNGWNEFNYPLGDKDPQFEKDLLDWESASEKVPLFSQLRQFNRRAIELYKDNNLYTPLIPSPVVIPIEVKDGKVLDTSYKAGCRLLGSGELILMQGLAVDLIEQGCILLAPEHDGLVVTRVSGLEDSITFPTLERLGREIFGWEFQKSITELSEYDPFTYLLSREK